MWKSIQQWQWARNSTRASHEYNVSRKKATEEYDRACYSSATGSLDSIAGDADTGWVESWGRNQAMSNTRSGRRWALGGAREATTAGKGNPWCSPSAPTFFFLTWVAITWHLLNNCLQNLTDVFYALFCIYIVSRYEVQRKTYLRTLYALPKTIWF